MAKEYGLGSMDGFQFNISVGYDLAGIKSEKINTFIENMKLADGVEFKELLAPVKMEAGQLVCNEMVLGEADASGRTGK